MKQLLIFHALALRALVVLGLGAGALSANTIVIGQPADVGTGDCIPFGCNNPPYNDEYQQVYNSSQFLGGPITITGLEFFSTQFNGGGTAIDHGNFTISLSTTTTADANNLSATFANNIGTNNTVVFSGDLGQSFSFGSTLNIALSQSFTYDPTQGNLLMDVSSTGVTATAGAGDVFFDTNGLITANNFMGAVFGPTVSPSGPFTGYGLVTGFDVPEPSDFIPLAGLLAMLFRMRRRKTV